MTNNTHLTITFIPNVDPSLLPPVPTTYGSGGATAASSGASTIDSAGVLQGQEQITEIAEASAFGLPITLPGTVSIATAVLFKGQKALYNDQALMQFISFLTKSAGRSFQSMPNGDFLAFFPDYFNWSKQDPYWNIADIEILDLTIDVDDTNLATHVFTTTDVYKTGSINILDELASTVASVEDVQTFESLVNVEHFDDVAFLQRYGARPMIVQDAPEITSSFMQYMYGWMQFLEQWAKLFVATPTVTFMPELWPGGLVKFGSRDLTMFIDSVTHNFDRSSGFTTTPTLIAPSVSSKGQAFNYGMVLTADGYTQFQDEVGVNSPTNINTNPGPQNAGTA